MLIIKESPTGLNSFLLSLGNKVREYFEKRPMLDPGLCCSDPLTTSQVFQTCRGGLLNVFQRMTCRLRSCELTVIACVCLGHS